MRKSEKCWILNNFNKIWKETKLNDLEWRQATEKNVKSKIERQVTQRKTWNKVDWPSENWLDNMWFQLKEVLKTKIWNDRDRWRHIVIDPLQPREHKMMMMMTKKVLSDEVLLNYQVSYFCPFLVLLFNILFLVS
mgnify:CR=1 FL=1